MNDGERYQPYLPADANLKELTPGAIILGIALGLVFAASSVHLALKIGLTVSASIPIAVLSKTIFRYISRAFGSFGESALVAVAHYVLLRCVPLYFAGSKRES